MAQPIGLGNNLHISGVRVLLLKIKPLWAIIESPRDEHNKYLD